MCYKDIYTTFYEYFIMEIKDGTYVVFAYSLSLDTGELLDISEAKQPVGFIVGSAHMLPSIEKQLFGMQAGESATIFLEPGEAFGHYDPDAIKEVPLDSFPGEIDLQPTMPFQAEGPDGPVTFVIKAVGDGAVTIDMNHPLAGRRMRCEVEIHEVRELTVTEKIQLARKKKKRRPSFNPFDNIPDDELQM
jgi:FKBP-type peptidyl-prolyl cis-trans isomerase SlyD